MRPHLCVGIDVGCKAHRIAIARPNGSLLEEFDISHSDAGFQEFFRRVEQHKEKLSLPEQRGAAAGVRSCTAALASSKSGDLRIRHCKT